jgi:hypothetical protein
MHPYGLCIEVEYGFAKPRVENRVVELDPPYPYDNLPNFILP